MKTALVTTTINIPTVLALYRKLGPDVRFFVALDKKTPPAVNEYLNDMPNCEWLSYPCEYACSELIGWLTIRRRNIAVLEALKWGADVIVTIDDDNIPMDNLYFSDFLQCFCRPYLWEDMAPFNGLSITTANGWFDPGRLMVPPTKHRGFPHEKLGPEFVVGSVVDRRVGVVAGLCLGDPDIDAVTRLELHPIIHSASELAHAGVITDPKNTTVVFNTQNTAYLRELAPAMFCPPGLGRHDDIYASLITQRIMREKGLCVHLGQPFVWQQRNPHNLINDLKDEVFGMEHIVEFSDWITPDFLSDKNTVVEQVRFIYKHLLNCKWWPSVATEAALAWCDDCEKVMG